MSSGKSSAPSGCAIGKELIDDRKILFSPVRLIRMNILPLDVLKRFKKYGFDTTDLSAPLQSLITVLRTPFADDQAFNLALFAAINVIINTALPRSRKRQRAKDSDDFESSPVVESLTSVKSTVVDDSASQIVIKLEQDEKVCFVGLVRECDRFPSVKPGHAVALFEPTGSGHKVNCFLTVVQLKLQTNQGPAAFSVRGNVIVEPFITDRHAFVAQTLAFVLCHVWPGICSCGVERESLPLTVIVGKGENVTAKGQLRSMRGQLIPSRTCCDCFRYTIEGFDTFEIDLESMSMSEAQERTVAEILNREATTYLESLLFGFDVARDFLAANIASPACKPLSGHTLFVGRETTTGIDGMERSVDVQLYPGVLTTLATAVRNKRPDVSIKVSQADLFQGVVSGVRLRSMHDLAQGDRKSIWFCEPENGRDYALLVKASACAIHLTTVPFETAFNSLRIAISDGEESLRQHLARVLVAVYLLPYGLVSIMRDIREHGYGTLRIEEFQRGRGESLEHFWMCVDHLVQEVLIPLARLELVHCDLRAAFDVTANILVKVERDRLDMVIIDWDSLVPCNRLPRFLEHDHRYVAPSVTNTRNAVEYLWWQVLMVAYVWSEQVTEKDLCAPGNSLLADVITKLSEVTQGRQNDIGNANEQPGAIIRANNRLTEVILNGSTKFDDWLLNDAVMRRLLPNPAGRQSILQLQEMLRRVGLFFSLYRSSPLAPRLSIDYTFDPRFALDNMFLAAPHEP